MLFIYYTGAGLFLYEQKDSIFSIGGYVSATRVPKDVMNNLFGDISNYGLQKATTDTKCFAIKNEGTITLNDVLIYFDVPIDSICEFEIAPVAPTIDDCGGVSFEKLTNSESSPYYGTFYKAQGVENQINVGSIEAGKYIGLFIKRKFKSTVIDNPCVSTEDLSNQQKSEKINLTISWL